MASRWCVRTGWKKRRSLFRQTLQLKPSYFKAHSNLGNVVRDLGRLDEALACYDRALHLQPDHPDAYRNRAMVHLLMGNFEQGWRDYEWRWRCQDVPTRPFPQPFWDGAPLAGKTILLHAEQGLGDSLQFIRYAPLVEERGGRVILECQEPLVPLLATCAGIDRVIVCGSTLPDFAVHAPLLSLPVIFGTTLTTLPAQVPYLFADAALVDHWRQELCDAWRVARGAWAEAQESRDAPRATRHASRATRHASRAMRHASRFMVGLAWQGNPRHPDDHRRSVPLARFVTLAQLPGVHLFSLQKGLGTEQLPAISKQCTITDLSSRLETFMDAAAVMMNLDLIITVDSALAHCAGREVFRCGFWCRSLRTGAGC